MCMKKLLNYCLSMTLMASLFLVTSCGEDPVEPVIAAPSYETIGEKPETVDVGEQISFTVNIAAPGGFNRLLVTKQVGTATATTFADIDRPAGTAPTSHTYAFTYTPNMNEAGETIDFKFLIVGEDAQETDFTYSVDVNDVTFMEYETVLLGGQSNATVESFYNAVENKKYMYAAAKENAGLVDFLYHYGSTNGNVISSPDNAETRNTWNTLDPPKPLTGMDNTTRFKEMTTRTYDEVINNTNLVNSYAENQNPELSRITQLAVGKSYAFKLGSTRGTRYGVIEIAQIQGTSGTDRTITLNVKIQAVNN